MDRKFGKPVAYWKADPDAGLEIGPNLKKPSTIEKTTMSVREMGALLGLKKTDSYWLMHKGFFRTISVNNTIRVDIADFERWYAGQVKYHKVDGAPPGEQLRKESYSAKDMAEMLGLSEATVYELITKGNMETITVDYQMRVPREAFEKWYSSQNRYRTAEDRERDREAEEKSIWLADLARMLGVSRNTAYYLAQKNQKEGVFEVIVVGERKRITKESFYHWYEGQTHYKLLTDEEMAAARAAKESKRLKRKQSESSPEPKQLVLREPKNPKFYTVDEICEFYGYTGRAVRKWLEKGTVSGIRLGKLWRIPREEFDSWLKAKYC